MSYRLTDAEIRKRILSTGIPLEKYVAKKITELGLLAQEQMPTKYSYEESPQAKIFEGSYDLLTSISVEINDKKDNATNVVLDFIIECEYRAPAIRWIFFEEILPPRLSKTLRSYRVQILSEEKPRLEWYGGLKTRVFTSIDKYVLSFPGCSRFVQVASREFKDETKPFFQVAAGLSNLYSEEEEIMKDIKDMDEKKGLWSFISYYIPVVVTTAEINTCEWNYERMKEFSKKAILKPLNIVAYKYNAPKYLRKFPNPSTILVVEADHFQDFLRRIKYLFFKDVSKYCKELDLTFGI